MATTCKYFVVNTNGDNTHFIDFDLRYDALTTVGEGIHFYGLLQTSCQGLLWYAF